MISPGPGAIAPTPSQVRGSVIRRVVVPTAILWVGVVAAGFLVVDVFALDERAINDAFVARRTPTLDTFTAVVSEMGNTQVLMATCLIVVAFIWWQSRQWWLAMLPALALGLEALVFLTSSIVIGRTRPDVEKLDHSPPTSSFPSGHTGASTAVYLTIALCATRIGNTGLRIVLQVVCVVTPVSIGVTRMYRGMHHPTDVVAGLIVGTTCALIAWKWLEVRDSAERIVTLEEGEGSTRASAIPPERPNDRQN